MSVRDMCTGEATVVPAALRGYRMWRHEGTSLRATSGLGAWPGPEVAATCRSLAMSEHAAPDGSCGCGIYGWYRPASTRLHRGTVFGVIEASGRVLLGDYGFRAERARVLALVAPENFYDAFTLAWQHRGVRVFDSRERLLEEFPPDDVRELLGRDVPDEPVDAMAGLVAAAAAAASAMADFERAWRKLSAQIAEVAHRDFERFVRAYAAAVRAQVPAPAPDTVDGLMARALEARRRGQRGPEKPRRGRARLDLP